MTKGQWAHTCVRSCRYIPGTALRSATQPTVWVSTGYSQCPLVCSCPLLLVELGAGGSVVGWGRVGVGVLCWAAVRAGWLGGRATPFIPGRGSEWCAPLGSATDKLVCYSSSSSRRPLLQTQAQTWLEQRRTAALYTMSRLW